MPLSGSKGLLSRSGEVLPLTHFLRIVRGILLKGNGMALLWPELWPLLAFLLGMNSIAIYLRNKFENRW